MFISLKFFMFSKIDFSLQKFMGKVTYVYYMQICMYLHLLLLLLVNHSKCMFIYLLTCLYIYIVAKSIVICLMPINLI